MPLHHLRKGYFSVQKMGSTTLSLCQGWGILLRRYGDFTTGGDTFLGGEFSTGTMGKFQPEFRNYGEISTGVDTTPRICVAAAGHAGAVARGGVRGHFHVAQRGHSLWQRRTSSGTLKSPAVLVTI